MLEGARSVIDVAGSGAARNLGVISFLVALKIFRWQ
jgi:hypothetical protein